MSCPLCNHLDASPSWLGATFYQGKEFAYIECQSCRSLYCEPMPDAKTLAHMYGVDYEKSFHADPAIADPKEPERVTKWLEKTENGTFLDYGCGAGNLLKEALLLGWQAVGVEYDDEVARTTAQRTGARVVSNPEALLSDGPIADVLHLGDVIEHLTDLNNQMPEILWLIKPGGFLIAQGPLEANANLFTLLLRVGRQLRKSRRTEMAPYHVLLATARGQREFFKRFGLKEVEYRVREVSWPAPDKLTVTVLKQPRSLILYALRRTSQLISALRPKCWGNRYFYVGRWNGESVTGNGS